jgi:hypothetical protein
VTVPLENKEETEAANVVITDVVLLIAPLSGWTIRKPSRI